MIFDGEFSDDEMLFGAVDDAMQFAVYHESGHALIDILKIPVTGREEDAADQLATLLLIEGKSAGAKMSLSAALMFYYSSQKLPQSSELYWENHSFDLQRYFNIVCLVYGSSPNEYAFLVNNEWLPAERAEYCAAVEYDQIHTSWKQLLTSYFTKDYCQTLYGFCS